MESYGKTLAVGSEKYGVFIPKKLLKHEEATIKNRILNEIAIRIAMSTYDESEARCANLRAVYMNLSCFVSETGLCMISEKIKRGGIPEPSVEEWAIYTKALQEQHVRSRDLIIELDLLGIV